MSPHAYGVGNPRCISTTPRTVPIFSEEKNQSGNEE